MEENRDERLVFCNQPTVLEEMKEWEDQTENPNSKGYACVLTPVIKNPRKEGREGRNRTIVIVRNEDLQDWPSYGKTPC